MERVNDTFRWAIDRLVGATAAVFRLGLFVRVKTFSWEQQRLRRRYGIHASTPVRGYEEQSLSNPDCSVTFAYTSGSTKTPKRIAYSPRRIRRTLLVFVSAIFRYLAANLAGNRAFFALASMRTDQSLTALLMNERVAPYLCGLQAPHGVLSHPAIRKAFNIYGDTAVRVWIMTVANPGMLYATNPSTIATFLRNIEVEWDSVRRLAERSKELQAIYWRIASKGAKERLRRIVSSGAPLPVRELFPGLRAFSCWDGGYVLPFIGQVREYLPESEYAHLPMFSMSTETIETIMFENAFLPMAPGVLYEFVEEGKAGPVRPEELQVGREYSMVVSDAYGLRRYDTEDLFECAGFVRGIPDLRFARRRGLAYSFTGEKLTAEHLQLAFAEAAIKFPDLPSIGFLTCFPSQQPVPCYRVMLVQSEQKQFDGTQITSFVEERLCEFNHEFRSKIESGRLGHMVFEIIDVRDFVQGESQFKFLPLYPRIRETFFAAEPSCSPLALAHGFGRLKPWAEANGLQHSTSHPSDSKHRGNKIKLVSWDVDGTLFSYMRLATALIGLAPGKIWNSGWGQTLLELRGVWKFHQIVEAQRRSFDSSVIEGDLAEFASTYFKEREALEISLGRIQPPKNVIELLGAFAAAGITQVALSDFECEYKLKALGVEQYFAAAYSCRDLGFWKPSPIPLEHIQKIYGVRPDEHLHIGDRADADGEACVRNGCQSAKPALCRSLTQVAAELHLQPNSSHEG